MIEYAVVGWAIYIRCSLGRCASSPPQKKYVIFRTAINVLNECRRVQIGGNQEQNKHGRVVPIIMVLGVGAVSPKETNLIMMSLKVVRAA